MQREEFRKLLHRYADGTCSKAEKRFLEEMVLRDPVIDNWSWENEEERVLMGIRIRQAIDKRRHVGKPSRYKRLWYGGVAASLLAVFGVMWFLGGKKDAQEKLFVISETASYPSDGIRLTLADGSVVGVDSLERGLVRHTGRVDIRKLDGGELVYKKSSNAESGSTSETPAQNTLHVPNGKQFKVVLPDGTKVWMNTATTLTYPVAFTGRERKVVLNGEAYFEVMTDRSRPFKVMTQGREITVTGTHFTVSAYASDNEVRTALLEGGVDVYHLGKTLSLTPGFEAISSTDGKLVKKQSNLEQAMAWKNGYFLFDDMDVISVMRSVARWYDVRIVIDANLPKKRFGGSFPITAGIDELLADLELVGKVKFERNGKEVRMIW
ncbi:FecR domain-containing protein [Sphingobacterium arenae]|uniref:FecR domain-containing protein n=1 Tax=Sphingobacterium arenae TaxID=1280598 RepID=A0ABR7Y4Q5_9SPHI|nr:FecR domain-containing protein [Sphingobacterium arenae]MBD1426293.1 FecR domain-containing protein [Sphingobacterium arenae]